MEEMFRNPIRIGVTEERVLQIIFENTITFNPPDGAYKVTNIYVNPSNGKLFIEYDDVPVGG